MWPPGGLRGRSTDAARLWGAAAALREEIFGAAWEAGRTLSPEQAVAQAQADR